MFQQASLGSEKAFNSLRSYFWPIHRREVRKFLPMLAILFLICFNHSVLRNMKDAIVVTASGAEVIPFIKVWVMFPMAILLTILFTKLSNRYSQERVFYIMVGGFLLFFNLFAFVFYPLRDVVHPHALADRMELLFPAGFRGLISMVRYWTFTGFYVMSELWASIVLHVLFWGFANEVTRIGEAGRFYSVFGVGSNISTICAGQASIFFTWLPSVTNFFGKGDQWEQTQMILIAAVTVCGVLAMLIFRWMNSSVLKDPSFDEFHHNKRVSKAKGKLSFRESFSYLSNSKYLLCIAVLVVSYNLVINLVEIIWKDQLRLLYPNPAEFNNYMNNLTSIMGVISTVTALFLAKIIARFGWTKTAMITPVIMLVTCAGFFTFLFFRDSLAPIVIALTGTTPLAIAVFFGGAQNCLSKAAKYSVFDTTKEMSYIPLSHECKLKGKAAIDGVGSRFGKSGGSLIHQGLLLYFSTLTASAPYVAGILMTVIGFWIVATKALGRQFDQLIASSSKPAEPPPEAAPSPQLDHPLPVTS
ncbi:MAG: Npt1/Npt2 family nucleotide transporter [Parachlamydiaceae bacterium]